MSKFIKSRYWLHFIIGLAIGYNLTSITDFYKYSTINKVVGVYAVTLICFCIGFFWEWIQSKFFEGKTDWNDIRWSAVGGFVGSVLCFMFWNNNYVFYTNIALILFFICKEIYTQLKK
jgi:hypothetical protein